MIPRHDQPISSAASPAKPQPARPSQRDAYSPRLNLLLSSAQWRHEPAFEQLPHLLAPLGIRSITATSGEEAADVIRTVRVHIAVVDLGIPMGRPPAPGACANDDAARFALASAGPRVLQLLRRLDAPPPTVVVRPPQAASRESARSLLEALREGAFAVLDRPVPLEGMLEVLRRILRRHYADAWPT